jgi:catechol 2,3-dioxygenase
MARYGSEATFMSVGGYHHHLGGNTWAGRGVKPPPPGSAALRHATMIVPGLAEERELVDPAGNRWLVTAA